MTEAHSDHYSLTAIQFLEMLWGDGFLSPGGPEELARLLKDHRFDGKTVVDIGSGAGGITKLLVEAYGAAHVIGLDVETAMVAYCRRKITTAGLQEKIEIRQVQPGPMPLDDQSIDIVFSKDSIVHIPNKESLAADAFRVLKPGGWFIASDWLISHDHAPSPEMAAYIAQEDIGFQMASPERYRRALAAAGFEAITMENRNPWYRTVARQELARLEGSHRAEFEAMLGAAEIETQITTWKSMVVVLDSGEHCPHHFQARKPA